MEISLIDAQTHEEQVIKEVSKKESESHGHAVIDYSCHGNNWIVSEELVRIFEC